MTILEFLIVLLSHVGDCSRAVVIRSYGFRKLWHYPFNGAEGTTDEFGLRFLVMPFVFRSRFWKIVNNLL